MPMRRQSDKEKERSARLRCIAVVSSGVWFDVVLQLPPEGALREEAYQRTAATLKADGVASG